jgi:hypothetical protein
MKTSNILPFSAGLVVGAAFISTAFAAGLVPAWNSANVTPVVLVEYSSIHGFRPAGSDSPVTPSWTKDQVSPVVPTIYSSLYGFVPAKSDALTALAPNWRKEEVKPWTEVVFNSMGQFVTRHSQ